VALKKRRLRRTIEYLKSLVHNTGKGEGEGEEGSGEFTGICGAASSIFAAIWKRWCDDFEASSLRGGCCGRTRRLQASEIKLLRRRRKKHSVSVRYSEVLLQVERVNERTSATKGGRGLMQ
jgi:hypothetical protein